MLDERMNHNIEGRQKGQGGVYQEKECKLKGRCRVETNEHSCTVDS